MPSTSKQGAAFAALSKDRPPVSSTREGPTRKERGAPFDWSDLVPFFIHPIKVAAIEALFWIDGPLSPVELERLFDVDEYSLGVVAYHVKELAKRGVIVQTGERQVRGARESFYFFPSS